MNNSNPVSSAGICRTLVGTRLDSFKPFFHDGGAGGKATIGVDMTAEEWVALGSPDTITVTIEPGDASGTSGENA